MATFAGLQTTIASELARDDLTTPIQAAILAAVRHYQRRLSLFGRATASTSTVAGTAEYDLPTDFVAFDFVTITVGSSTYTLLSEAYEKLLVDDTSGQPGYYAIRGTKLRLGAIPDAVYVVDVYYWQAKAAPDTSDTTVWTNDLVDLIRHRAKVDVAANNLRDDAGAQQYRAQEFDILDGVIAQRDRVLSNVPVELTSF